MATIVPLPDPGDGSLTGTVERWLVREGEHVHAAQDLAEVMFDSATVLIPAPSAGRVIRRCAKSKADVRVGAPLLELD
jgi:pyruvate/2-oxoglutarate dehydrogenase complex dihydrolipoamide acyltransferase (E2) component